MRCNIDARGKSIRLAGGVIACVMALVFLILAGVGVWDRWAWFVGAGALITGVFMVIEGWSGWCALRAMGFKTRA